jgi:hypothetical protein
MSAYPPELESFLEQVETADPGNPHPLKKQLEEYIAAAPVETQTLLIEYPLVAGLLETLRTINHQNPSCRLALRPFAEAIWERTGVRLSREQIFGLIYFHNLWGGTESLSGTGSQLSSTQDLRSRLQELLQRYQIRSIVDAPCGDFCWMKEVIFPPTVVEYCGIDIVKSLIQANQAKYGSESIRFLTLDLVTNEPPQADLIICRDLFIHLALSECRAVLANFRSSGARQLLISSASKVRQNEEIAHTGTYRPLNLELPPFDLGEKLEVLDDSQQPGDHSELLLFSLT